MKIKKQSYIKLPKWSGGREFLQELAWDNNINLTIIERDKGFIQETIYFEVKGDINKVHRFFLQFNESIRDYNEKR